MDKRWFSHACLALAFTSIIWLLGAGCSDPVEPIADSQPNGRPAGVITQASLDGQQIDLGFRIVETEGPFLVFDKEPTERRIRPESTAAIVPVARVHEHLQGMQSDSFRGTGPYIVRYEVVDLEPLVLPSLLNEDALSKTGLVATALVYVVDLSGEAIPISAHGAKIFNPGENNVFAGEAISPPTKNLRIEAFRIHLLPVGVAKREVKSGTLLLVGTKDWRVRESKKIGTVSADHLMKKLPILDPSALELFD